MITVLSTHAAVIAQVRRAAEAAGRVLTVITAPRELRDLPAQTLLVIDAATAALHGTAIDDIIEFHRNSPQTRVVLQMLLEQGNAELRLMLELQPRIKPHDVIVLIREQLEDTVRWDEIVGQVEARLEAFRSGVRTVFMTSLMAASRGKRTFDAAGARVLCALLDETPDINNVKELATQDSKGVTTNAARIRQNRAWRSVFGETRLPTNLCIILFKLVWYKYLTLDKEYSRLEAYKFLHLQPSAFSMQIKRRTGLSKPAVDALSLEALTDWVATVCLTEFAHRPDAEALTLLAPARLRHVEAPPLARTSGETRAL